jgi:Pyruvate/2-oxoacid:ferredoxin oxidoreductase delta subunit
MTHNELLDIVQINERTANGHYGTKALRAVMEIHKPVLHSKHKYICEGCNLVYPCDTIEAIEKELQ